ncbi:HPr family phosphocarrier protein [Paenibacillus eucommiae]|uniref:Phosphocarrier protein n=1 Tax=Paenibacillus eucommiae TaxID=1355755 RepID=A0ABS4IU51_9BACL|nr:HPr family phosphocarrier protein [Paenibacillus eucommiae]MBP1991083.1 phosphocarrier protein [Paenibacillus eucommiae]
MMIRQTVTVLFEEGMHIRPANDLVQITAQFQSDIQFERDDETADGKSVMEIMMLGAEQGHELQVTVEGEDEQAAMDAVTAFFNGKDGQS